VKCRVFGAPEQRGHDGHGIHSRGCTTDAVFGFAGSVESQGSATREISRNVAEVASSAAKVTSNITEVNQGASETGSASSQVLASAKSLSTESNRLKLEVDKFLKAVRAA